MEEQTRISLGGKNERERDLSVIVSLSSSAAARAKYDEVSANLEGPVDDAQRGVAPTNPKVLEERDASTMPTTTSAPESVPHSSSPASSPTRTNKSGGGEHHVIVCMRGGAIITRRASNSQQTSTALSPPRSPPSPPPARKLLAADGGATSSSATPPSTSLGGANQSIPHAVHKRHVKSSENVLARSAEKQCSLLLSPTDDTHTDDEDSKTNERSPDDESYCQRIPLKKKKGSSGNKENDDELNKVKQSSSPLRRCHKKEGTMIYIENSDDDDGNTESQRMRMYAPNAAKSQQLEYNALKPVLLSSGVMSYTTGAANVDGAHLCAFEDHDDGEEDDDHTNHNSRTALYRRRTQHTRIASSNGVGGVGRRNNLVEEGTFLKKNEEIEEGKENETEEKINARGTTATAGEAPPQSLGGKALLSLQNIIPKGLLLKSQATGKLNSTSSGVGGGGVGGSSNGPRGETHSSASPSSALANRQDSSTPSTTLGQTIILQDPVSSAGGRGTADTAFLDDDLDVTSRTNMHHRNVFLAKMAYVCLYGAFSSCVPFYGVYLYSRGFDPLTIGLIVVLNPLGTVLLLPLLTILVERRDLQARRRYEKELREHQKRAAARRKEEEAKRRRKEAKEGTKGTSTSTSRSLSLKRLGSTGEGFLRNLQTEGGEHMRERKGLFGFFLSWRRKRNAKAVDAEEKETKKNKNVLDDDDGNLLDGTEGRSPSPSPQPPRDTTIICIGPSSCHDERMREGTDEQAREETSDESKNKAIITNQRDTSEKNDDENDDEKDNLFSESDAEDLSGAAAPHRHSSQVHVLIIGAIVGSFSLWLGAVLSHDVYDPNSRMLEGGGGGGGIGPFPPQTTRRQTTTATAVAGQTTGIATNLPTSDTSRPPSVVVTSSEIPANDVDDGDDDNDDNYAEAMEDTVYAPNSSAIMILVAITVAIQALFSVPIPPFVDSITMGLLTHSPLFLQVQQQRDGVDGNNQRQQSVSNHSPGGNVDDEVARSSENTSRERGEPTEGVEDEPTFSKGSTGCTVCDKNQKGTMRSNQSESDNLNAISENTKKKTRQDKDDDDDKRSQSSGDTAVVARSSSSSSSISDLDEKKNDECASHSCCSSPTDSCTTSFPSAAAAVDDPTNANSNLGNNSISTSANNNNNESSSYYDPLVHNNNNNPNNANNYYASTVVGQWNQMRSFGTYGWAAMAPIFAMVSDDYGYGLSFVGYALGVLGACVLLLKTRNISRGGAVSPSPSSYSPTTPPPAPLSSLPSATVETAMMRSSSEGADGASSRSRGASLVVATSSSTAAPPIKTMLTNATSAKTITPTATPQQQQQQQREVDGEERVVVGEENDLSVAAATLVCEENGKGFQEGKLDDTRDGDPRRELSESNSGDRPSVDQRFGAGEKDTECGDDTEDAKTGKNDGEKEVGENKDVTAVLRFVLHPLQRRILTFLGATAVMGMGLSFLSTYLFIYLRSDRDCPQLLLGFCVAIAVLVEIPLFRNGKWIHERFSDRQLLGAAMVAWSFRAGLVTVVGRGPYSWWVLAIEPLHGVAYALCWMAGVNALMGALPPQLASVATIISTVHTSVYGVGNALGMIIGGLGVETFGFANFFRIASIMMALAAGVFVVADRYLEKEYKFRHASIDALAALTCEAISAEKARVLGEEEVEARILASLKAEREEAEAEHETFKNYQRQLLIAEAELVNREMGILSTSVLERAAAALHLMALSGRRDEEGDNENKTTRGREEKAANDEERCGGDKEIGVTAEEVDAKTPPRATPETPTRATNNTTTSERRKSSNHIAALAADAANLFSLVHHARNQSSFSHSHSYSGAEEGLFFSNDATTKAHNPYEEEEAEKRRKKEKSLINRALRTISPSVVAIRKLGGGGGKNKKQNAAGGDDDRSFQNKTNKGKGGEEEETSDSLTHFSIAIPPQPSSPTTTQNKNTATTPTTATHPTFAAVATAASSTPSLDPSSLARFASAQHSRTASRVSLSFGGGPHGHHHLPHPLHLGGLNNNNDDGDTRENTDTNMLVKGSPSRARNASLVVDDSPARGVGNNNTSNHRKNRLSLSLHNLTNTEKLQGEEREGKSDREKRRSKRAREGAGGGSDSDQHHRPHHEQPSSPMLILSAPRLEPTVQFLSTDLLAIGGGLCDGGHIGHAPTLHVSTMTMSLKNNNINNNKEKKHSLNASSTSAAAAVLQQDSIVPSGGGSSKPRGAADHNQRDYTKITVGKRTSKVNSSEKQEEEETRGRRNEPEQSNNQKGPSSLIAAPINKSLLSDHDLNTTTSSALAFSTNNSDLIFHSRSSSQKIFTNRPFSTAGVAHHSPPPPTPVAVVASPSKNPKSTSNAVRSSTLSALASTMTSSAVPVAGPPVTSRITLMSESEIPNIDA